MASPATEEAVLLWKVRHGDHGFVLRMFTLSGGIRPFILQGVKGKKAALSAYLFPLSILELELSGGKSGSMGRIAELRPAIDVSDLRFDVHKNAIATLIAEILNKCIAEGQSESMLYYFIKMSVRQLANARQMGNFHLSFLIHLSHYLGFLPQLKGQTHRPLFLDLREGLFVAQRPLHLDYLEQYFTEKWMEFIKMAPEDSASISLRRSERREILEQILKFYAIHLPGTQRLKTPEVLVSLYD
jgi:DNA repair protein RecO (recombination protein O)